MKVNTILFSALLLATSGSGAFAERLDQKEIVDFIGGKKVLLATGYGIEFPMYYRANGSVTGDGEGTTLGKFFAPKETGRWWVDGSQMCQQFPTWYDGKPLCFELKRTGDTTMIWYREDGKKGTARISG